MKKSTAVIFILIFSLVSTLAFAQAEYKIDGNLGEAGFQDNGTIVNGIGGGQRIGFAVYVRNVPTLVGFELDLTWDDTKAASFTTMTGPSILGGTFDINGAEMQLDPETNVLGAPAGIPTSEPGHLNAAYALLGGSSSAEDWSLVYVALWDTDDSFTTSEDLVISTELSVSDGTTITELGGWNFYVNSSVGVDDKTWGEIKTDFDF